MSGQELLEKSGLLFPFLKFFQDNDVREVVIENILVFLVRLIIVLITFWISKKVINYIGMRMEYWEHKKDMNASLVGFFVSMFKVASYSVLVMGALVTFGISESSIAAVFGAAGLGVGFAIKDILANFSGGMIILFFHPYKVGDFVEIGNKSGEVYGINIFSTEINTTDNKKIFIPNGSIVTNDITNYSANHVRRVEIIFSVGYECDFRKAIKILEGIADSHDKIIHTIDKTIRVRELGNSSVNILFRVWCKNSDYWSVHFDCVELSKEEFDKNGISIPFPQMDVHINKESLKAMAMEELRLNSLE